MAVVNEQIVTGRKFRKLIDEASRLWLRISFWTKACDVEFDDGETLDTKFNNLKQSFQDGCKKIVDKLTALGHRPNDPQGPDEICTAIDDMYNKRYSDGYADGMNKTVSGNAKIKYKYHEHSSACGVKNCVVTVRFTNVGLNDPDDPNSLRVCDRYEIHNGCGLGTVITKVAYDHQTETSYSHQTYACGKQAGQLEGAEIVFE